MKRRLPYLAVLAISGTCALRVSADAPTHQYKDFNYLDRRIIDLSTHLHWERAISAPLLEPQIDAYCVAPTRLPTVKELLTLFDEVPNVAYDSSKSPPGNVVAHIDLNAFPIDPMYGFMKVDVPFCTQTKNSGGLRFTVDFGQGGLTQPTAPPCRVRCVQYVAP